MDDHRRYPARPVAVGPDQFQFHKYGQRVYAVPEDDLVLVRLGRDLGYRHWPELLSEMARWLEESTSGGRARR